MSAIILRLPNAFGPPLQPREIRPESPRLRAQLERVAALLQQRATRAGLERSQAEALEALRAAMRPDRGD